MTHRTRPGLSLGTVVAVLAALAAGAAGGYFLSKQGSDTKKEKDAAAARPPADRISALGRLQPAGGVVPVFGPPGDQIVELADKLAPGVKLDKNEVIGKLKSADVRDREVTIAGIQLREAKDALAAAKEAGKKRIAAAEAELKQAEASRDTDLKALDVKVKFLTTAAGVAATQLNRARTLRDMNVRVAQEEIEKAELQVAQADAEREGAVALREKTRVTYDSTVEAARAKIAAANADLKAEEAKAPVESGDEKLKLAKDVADLTRIRAPIAGHVLKVTGRVGQPTGLEPILQMAQLDSPNSLTAVTEVYESDVRDLRRWLAGKGVKAEVRNAALGDGDAMLTGEVQASGVTQMIARNAVFAMGPREDADRRVVEVVVTLVLTPEQKTLASGLVGLQVTVVLTPK